MDDEDDDDDGFSGIRATEAAEASEDGGGMPMTCANKRKGKKIDTQ